jgi:hypothetical protein
MRRLILCFFIVVPFYQSAQNSGDLSVEFGFQKRMFRMSQFNAFLLTPYSYNPNLYLTPPNDRIDDGIGFDLTVKYQPFNTLDLGIYGSFQSGKVDKSVNYYLINQIISDTTVFSGNYKMNTLAFTGGITCSYHLNKVLNFQSKTDFLQSFLLSIEGRLGFGYAYLRDVIYFNDPPFVQEFSEFGHSALGVQGEIGLKAGYRFVDNPLFSALSLKVGYQYLSTSNLRDNNGYPVGANGAESNLDYSGLFIGSVLSIGKR